MLQFSEPLSMTRGDFTLGPVDITSLQNEVAILLGDNGAGKSTLFRAMWEASTSRGIRVGFLPQSFTLPPFCRVIDACDFVARDRIRGHHEARREQVERALELTDLAEHSRKTCRALSGGMTRRLGICLTLIGDPQLVMLDEPTVGLDITQRASVLDVIEALARDIPVVMSTHLPSDLSSLGSRVLMLDRGRLTFDGSREEFLRGPDGEPTAWEDAYRARLTRGGDA